jgi:hypothetical protein
MQDQIGDDDEAAEAEGGHFQEGEYSSVSRVVRKLIALKGQPLCGYDPSA